MSRLRAAIESGEFAVTSEVGPPKGTDVSKMLEVAESLRGRVHAFNVTDNQAAVMRLSTLAACIHLVQRGLEPVLQMTCRDRNRIELQSDLLGAASFGIENVLALTGDHVVVGDHPQAKGVFDLESVQLLGVIKKLNEGTDMMGNALAGTPEFFPGAVVTPDANPLAPQLAKFEKKVRAGARYFQTQAAYDAEHFREFMSYAHKLGAKVLVGIVVLRSAGMARFMNANIPGIHVPAHIIDRLAASSDPVGTGIQVAAEFVSEVRDVCDGVHIMAVGAEHLVPRVLDALELEAVSA
jgi:methylenetetrahydrofolate reductase (NADPH)